MENMTISNINSSNSIEFARISSGGELIGKDITFQNSRTSLFNFLNSKATLEIFSFVNVNNATLLMKFLN